MENTLHIVATHLQSSQFVTFLHCCIVFTVESFHLRKKSSDQNVSENFPVSSTSTSTTMTIDHQHQPPCRKLKRFSTLRAKSKPKNSCLRQRVLAGLIYTGLIQAGLIQAGLIWAGFIQTGLIQTGLIQAGFIQTGLIQAGFIYTGLIQAKHCFLCKRGKCSVRVGCFNCEK